MEIANIVIVALVIVILLRIIKPYNDNYQSRILQKKFVSMGNLIGKTYSEIKSVAGNPSITQDSGDGTCYTWDSTKYAIKLKFDKNNVCIAKIGDVSKR